MRKAALAGVPKNRMITFPAKDEKHRVIVFTDIDCGYCRKLHQQIAEYNNLGITIDYLFFPRSGPNTPSFDKAVTVWCSADKNKAFTEAKAGVEQEKKTCDNPIAADFELGQKIGVTGTPMIVAARRLADRRLRAAGADAGAAHRARSGHQVNAVLDHRPADAASGRRHFFAAAPRLHGDSG